MPNAQPNPDKISEMISDISPRAPELPARRLANLSAKDGHGTGLRGLAPASGGEGPHLWLKAPRYKLHLWTCKPPTKSTQGPTGSFKVHGKPGPESRVQLLPKDDPGKKHDVKTRVSKQTCPQPSFAQKWPLSIQNLSAKKKQNETAPKRVPCCCGPCPRTAAASG